MWEICYYWNWTQMIYYFCFVIWTTVNCTCFWWTVFTLFFRFRLLNLYTIPSVIHFLFAIFFKNYLSTNVFNWEYVCIIYYLLSFISFLSQIMGSYSIFMFLPCHSSESSLKGQNFVGWFSFLFRFIGL